jgi:hypothetical protein
MISLVMKVMSLRLAVSVVVCASLLLPAANAVAQQTADPTFNVTVAQPAYTKNFPRVLFDEAHNNRVTTTGRYKPFADLIFSDGYHVVVNRNQFTKASLQSFKILVIANPLGAEDVDEAGADQAAFTVEESDAVYDWIRGGGSLLLVADPAPFGPAADTLAKRLGVELGKRATRDPVTESADKTWIVYSRENKLILHQPITAGRSDAERINRVMTFTGQSLKGPDGSVPFLKLANTALDDAGTSGDKEMSAAGRAQGLAIKLGKGRIVVLGDAEMLSAQASGPEASPVGMNYPGNDNRQLVLNIMHWLSGLLPER